MRFRKERDGNVVQPRMRRYYMKCCDCGLVHRLVFTVLKQVGRTRNGYKRGKRVTGHYIQFRAYRIRGRK